MSLVRFDPFELVRDLDRLFDSPTPQTGMWLPRVDVFERDAELVVRAEVPGIDADSLDVTVEGGTLTISGTRSFESETDVGGFHRKPFRERGHLHLPESRVTEAAFGADEHLAQ